MKNILQLGRKYSVGIVLSTIIVLYSIYYPLTFNYEVEVNYHYYFFNGIIVLLIPSFFFVFWKERCTNDRILFMLLVGAIFFGGYLIRPGNEHGYNILSFLSVFVFIWSVPQERGAVHRVLLPLGAFFLFEIFLGGYQSLSNDNNWMFNVFGSFANSGIYACGMVILIPMTVYYLDRTYARKRIGKVLIAVAHAAVILLIIITQSRTALLGFLAYSLYRGYENRNMLIFYFKKWKLYVMAFLVLSAVFIFLTFNTVVGFKQSSSLGRLLIWKVSLAHLVDDFFWGIGIGRFSYYYPIWQSSFFSGNAVGTALMQSAGKTYTGFNEFITYFKELGLVLFSLLVFYTVRFFRMQDRQDAGLLRGLKLTIMVTLVCSFSTYVLHSTLILTVITTVLAVALKLKASIGKPMILSVRHRTMLTVVFLVPFSILLYHSSKHSADIYQWTELRRKVPAMDRSACIKEYKMLGNKLSFEPKFVISYAEMLLQDNQHVEDAIRLLTLAKTESQAPEIFTLLGYSYRIRGDYKNALKAYGFLSDLVPGKFEYKAYLMETYKECNEPVMARTIADYILKMPVKIPSAEVDEIKDQARMILTPQL